MSQLIFLVGECILLPLLTVSFLLLRIYIIKVFTMFIILQHFVVPVTLTSCVSLEAIGFDFRYEAWTGPSGSVTIESFSSETNMWTSIDLRLASCAYQLPLF
ncbi:hypothetical protein H5410_024793 [Solanum commersonii]|uniref:Uncharacterized protein n=1 Tax=Solanum commersonii TaxID=4109 RepID=A0A9J5ZMZ4_SOLCO|nr:hypothetical protein H5410_024793 [Solanum commersonii]